jgi:hypothetical protein
MCKKMDGISNVKFLLILFCCLVFYPAFIYAGCADSWSSIHSSGSVNFYGVASDGSTIVLTGDAGVIEYSTNGGSTWSSVDKGSMTFTDVVFADDLFVAVATGGKIYTSSNGSTWTSRTSGTSSHLQGVCYTGSKFVAVGSQVCTTSSDGITWSASTQTGKYFEHVCSNGSTLIAGGPSSKVYRSTNSGSSWSTVTSGLSGNIKGVAYGDGRWVVGNNGGKVFYSDNGGTSWTEATDTDLICYDMVYAYDTFIMASDKISSKNIAVSTNGTSWTKKLVGSGHFRGVGWTGTEAIVVGAGSIAYESDCGCTQTAAEMQSPPEDSRFPSNKVTFTWSEGSCVHATESYRLKIGYNGVGSDDRYNSGWITDTNAYVTSLWYGNQKTYVRLETKYTDSTTDVEDYNYTSCYKSAITDPLTSVPLNSSIVTFYWNEALGGDGLDSNPYQLLVGTTGAGSSDVCDSGWLSSTPREFEVSGIPTNGSWVYVKINTKFYDQTVSGRNYTYTAVEYTKAGNLVPADTSTLTSSSETISWDAGVGVRASSRY